MRALILIAIISLWISSPAPAATLAFQNFGQEIQLLQQQNHYVVAGSGQAVRIANRLIVQVSPALERAALAQRHNAIDQVTLLFEGNSSKYFMLALAADADLSAVLEDLAKQENILLVQPDLLQLTQRAHTLNTAAAPAQDFLPAEQRTQLWRHSRGEGVKIAIIDDGFDLSHPALASTQLAFSFDTETRSLTAAPLHPRDWHGTAVAGVLFASDQPGRIQGLTPDAELIAIRQPDSWTSNTLLAFHLAALAGADVINCSWTTPLLLQPVADAVSVLAQEGRHGKGIAVVFAAGNDGHAIPARSSEAAIEDAIVVAAADAQGQRLPISNFGRSVDLTAFGDTVDSTAASGGYTPFGGTSLAAAIVTGTAALLIGADPDLNLPTLVSRLRDFTAHATPTSVTPYFAERLNAQH